MNVTTVLSWVPRRRDWGPSGFTTGVHVVFFHPPTKVSGHNCSHTQKCGVWGHKCPHWKGNWCPCHLFHPPPKVCPQLFKDSKGTQTQGGQRSDLQGRNASHAASSWRYPGRVWQGSKSSSRLVGGGSSFSEYVTGNGIRESFRNTKIHESQSLCRKTSMITIRAHFWK